MSKWLEVSAFLVQASNSELAGNGPILEVILVIFAIVGGIAGLQQLYYFWVGRKRTKAIHKVLDDVAMQLDADEVERRVQDLKEIERKLQLQVEREVPRQATRIYLESRRDQLVRDLGELYREYADIQKTLRDDSEYVGLEPALRAAIESRIAPVFHRKERRDRVIVAGIGILIVMTAYLVMPLMPFWLNCL